MELLKKSLFLILLFPFASSAEEKLGTAEIATDNTCESFQVFKDSVDYLKKQKLLPFGEPQILKASLEISKGCNGADKRFKKVFEVLVKSGVDIKKSYELAINFAKMSDAKADNFTVIFKGLFLENKFDLDFMTAYKLSLDLSASLPKDWEKVQREFRLFLDYCSSAKSEDLPIHLCAKWTLSLLKHEPQFSAGIYPSFDFLQTFLTKRPGPQLPVYERLKLIEQIVAYGPKAPQNFKKSLEWLGSRQGAGLPTGKAHQLALEIAKNSLKQPEPGVIPENTEQP